MKKIISLLIFVFFSCAIFAQIEATLIIDTLTGSYYALQPNGETGLIRQQPILISNDATITSTTTTGIEVINRTFTLPKIGDYLITITGQANGDAVSSDFIVKASVNGQNIDTNRPEIAQRESKDHGGNVNNTRSQQAYSVLSRTTNTLNLSNTIIVEVMPEIAGVEASTWTVKVTINTLENYLILSPFNP